MPYSISGFWPGTIAPQAKIERYIFGEFCGLQPGLPGSFIRCDKPVGVAGNGQMITTETGDRIHDGDGSVIVESLVGTPFVLAIRLNGADVGSATFDPGALNGLLSFPQLVQPSPGDMLELVGGTEADADLSNVAWTFIVS